MRQIIYYVASSIDGYISGPDGDISGFPTDGEAVQRYFKDLEEFDTVIMGRHTYEFGYKFGLEPGQPAYLHMDHYIFSTSLKFDQLHDKVHVVQPDISIVSDLKQQEGSSIYLCGGGIFAGWLLDHEMIDILKIKLNPMILGSGIRIFGNSTKFYKLKLQDYAKYDHGLQFITYEIEY